MNASERLFQVYLSLRGTLQRSVAGIVPPKEVEDIVQETYVRACQIERKTKINTPRSFLLKTARNLALDHIKRAEVRLTDSLEDDAGDFQGHEHPLDDPLEEVASHEEFALFCEAVRQLPAQCRRAFVLKKVYGYSRREIAGLMGVTENTVQTQIARGMKSCTYYLEQIGGDQQCSAGGRSDRPGQCAQPISRDSKR